MFHNSKAVRSQRERQARRARLRKWTQVNKNNKTRVMITEEVDQSRMDSVSDGKQIFSTLLSFCVWLGKGHIVFDISGSF